MNWDWGLRTGIGLNLPFDNWDLYLNFTYFENNDSNSSHKKPPAALFALAGFFGGNFDHAKSTCEILYLNLDLELGRNYFLSRYLAFRPHLGVKAMRMHLQQKVHYDFSLFEFNGDLVGEFYRVRLRSDSEGIGPKIGAQGIWFLGYGFRLFSELTAALLYENDEVWEKNSASPGASDLNVNVCIKGNGHHITPFFQIFSGLSYGLMFIATSSSFFSN